MSDGPSRGSFVELEPITKFTRDHPVCLLSGRPMLQSESMLECELGQMRNILPAQRVMDYKRIFLR